MNSNKTTTQKIIANAYSTCFQNEAACKKRGSVYCRGLLETSLFGVTEQSLRKLKRRKDVVSFLHSGCETSVRRVLAFVRLVAALDPATTGGLGSTCQWTLSPALRGSTKLKGLSK
jgi:hypothetical protein